MDKQLLFDRYVEGNMSEAEIKAFQESLKKDASLAAEYQIYLYSNEQLLYSDSGVGFFY